MLPTHKKMVSPTKNQRSFFIIIGIENKEKNIFLSILMKVSSKVKCFFCCIQLFLFYSFLYSGKSCAYFIFNPKKMKKNLLLILVFIVVVVGIVLLYFAFAPKVQSDLPPQTPTTGDPQFLSGETTGTEQTFEESFYQDLSDLFGGTTNGYEDIQGEYGFVQ
jgi:hypothetical protein